MAQFVESYDGETKADESRCNLILILSPSGLLMGMKTRGFGAGKLVLPGGKEKISGPGFDGKRTPVVDIHEELFEESGVSLPAHAFIGVGYLFVEQDDGETRDILLAKAVIPHTPVLMGSEELKDPAWYPTDNLPFEQMPADYQMWLPSALGDYMITGFLRNTETDFAGTEILGQSYFPELGRLEVLAIGPLSA